MGSIPGRPPDIQHTAVSSSPLTTTAVLQTAEASFSNQSIVKTAVAKPPAVDVSSASVVSSVPGTSVHPSQSSVLDPLAQKFTPLTTGNTVRGQGLDIVDTQAGIMNTVSQLDGDPLAKWLSGDTRKKVPVNKWKKASPGEEPLLPLLPFMEDPELTFFPKPAEPVIRSGNLSVLEVKIPGATFLDKVLPPPATALVPNPNHSPSHFVTLGNLVAASGYDGAGFCYPAGTPNFLGARIPLTHTSLKIDRWRQHLIGYEDAHLCQFLTYGFPLGLQKKPEIVSCTRNHGSSYNFYPHIDKFVRGEIMKNGLTGPFLESPWVDLTCAPLMTAAKKPDGRRAVYDATFGEKSINNATPSDVYLGQPCVYTFPKINDFRLMILKCGRNSFMFKRDLERYYLQLPLCPSEYHRVAFVWRGLMFFFIALMFGLRHSGLQGQRTTDAVAWIHRKSGLDSPEEQEYNVCNYSDDMGGAESSLERAKRSFLGLKFLFSDLGLSESVPKASPPSRQMVFLGVHFDTEKMEMSVPPDKLSELKAEIDRWARKTTITKRELQSLLGRLFWVAKVVRFARIFMGRLLAQLRTMSGRMDHEKVKLEEQTRKDLLWWSKFLRSFNGVSIIMNEEAIPLSLDQLLDTTERVCAGDATPTGIGAWHNHEYWSQLVPSHLQGLPIHLLEFWAVIVSCKVWGEHWGGKVIQIFTDNDPVADVISNEKPKDPEMLKLLREFIYIVCEKKFIPVLRKISSKDNALADHISRRFDEESAREVFRKHGLTDMKLVAAPDTFFRTNAPW